MIIDFNQADAPTNYSPKLCIVGAGAVGLSIASRFINTPNLEVLIIESGGLQPLQDPAKSNVINSGEVDSCVDGSFNQCFGGSTVSWGGQALPFQEIDLATRPWVVNSQWPIEYQDIHQYYAEAEKLLSIDYLDFNHDIWSKYSPEYKIPFEQNGLELNFSKWLPEPNFSRLYKSKISQSSSATTLINAAVREIKIDQKNKRVKELQVISRDGKKALVQPSITIIAAGGIENIRILLHSTQLSTCLPQLGKYYQDHIGFYGARLHPRNWKKFRALFATKFFNGKKCLPKIALTSNRQSKNLRLNVTGNLGIEYHKTSTTKSVIALYHALKKPTQRQFILKHSKNLIANSPEMIASIYSYLIQKQIYIPKEQKYFLIANCESPPMQESTITLSDEDDCWMMKKAKINWLLDDASRDSMLDYYLQIKNTLETNDIADVVIKESLFQNDREWLEKVYSLYHHMGGTRMGQSATDSVVNSNLKVHSVENLYIAGCSVFPTTSSSNPTFTAIALALRLADHIEEKLLT